MHNTNPSQTSNNTYATARDAVNPDFCEASTATAKTPIKAILIDPFEMTVSEVDYGGEMADIYRLIDADLFTVAGFGEDGDGVYVDDEGLFKGTQRFFKLDGYPQPLAGKGLVLGSNDGGESVAPVTTLEAVRAAVRWVQPLSQHLWIDSDSGALLTTKELCTY